MEPENQKLKDFRHYLQSLAALADSEAGFFGPATMVWRISREPILLLFGMRALLLQISHPAVAQAVADHSRYERNPLGRGIRTFRAVHALVFGSREQALKAAMTVYRIHASIHGRFKEPPPGFSLEYSASDPESLFWVAATLLDCSVLAYESCIKSLSEREKEQFYQEGKRFGQLFGVPLALYPATWPEFKIWMENTISGHRIFVTPAARDIFHGLLFGTWLTRLIAPVNYSVAAMTMPQKLRRQFGLKQTRWVEFTYKALLAIAILIMRCIPVGYRAVPAARHAERRLT